MNQILNNYKFFADAQLQYLDGRVHPDKFSGVKKKADKLMGIIERYGDAKEKIERNIHLSGAGQLVEIEKEAKIAYDVLKTMKKNVGYEAHIQQLDQQIDVALNPVHTAEEKLLRQLQLAEIRSHLGQMDDKQVLSIYHNAAEISDMMTLEAVEKAPAFMFADSLLGPIIKVTLENRRDTVKPELSSQIGELRRCQSATHSLIGDAINIVGRNVDTIEEIVNGEISMGTEGTAGAGVTAEG